MSGGQKFYLTEKEAEAFYKIREICQKPLTLEAPVAGDRFLVFVDASDVAIEGVIAQRKEDGRLRICNMYSQKLIDSQRAWIVAEKEALALAQTLWKYKYLLVEDEFDLYTDHKNLTKLFSWSATNSMTRARVQRWAICIQSFNFVLRHVPGILNQGADFLSRIWEKDDEEHIKNYLKNSSTIMSICAKINRKIKNNEKIMQEIIDKEFKDENLKGAISVATMNEMTQTHMQWTLPKSMPVQTRAMKKRVNKVKTNEQIAKETDESIANANLTSRRSKRLQGKKRDYLKMHNYGKNTKEELLEVFDEIEVTNEMQTDVTNTIKNAIRYLSEPATHKQFTDVNTIIEEQQRDSTIKAHHQMLTHDMNHGQYIEAKAQLTLNELKTHKNLTLQNDIVYYDNRIYLPFKLRYGVIMYYHTSIQSPHTSQKITYENVKENYYWPDMEDDIRTAVQYCIPCQKQKIGTNKTEGMMLTYENIHPFHSIYIDIIGPFTETRNGHKYVLTLGDRMSSYVRMIPMYEITAEETALSIKIMGGLLYLVSIMKL